MHNAVDINYAYILLKSTGYIQILCFVNITNKNVYRFKHRITFFFLIDYVHFRKLIISEISQLKSIKISIF